MRGGLAIRNAVATQTVNMATTSFILSVWTTFLAKLPVGASGFEIFNPSSTTFMIAFGAVGQEKALPYTIIPGGSAFVIPLEGGAGQRISLQPVDVQPTSGYFTMNFFG
jgi:hypothetical protein